ncbi:MAG: response regulator [Deltaproteobacteria bacterium]|nr:response regulator [Deltaproteobacteria bacterium]
MKEGKAIRVLLLEDSSDDAELMERELVRSGLNLETWRVVHEDAFRQAMESFRPDIILADYRLPAFDGMTALSIVHDKYPNTPFIMVTGFLNEETVVECMKAGAWDYLLKGQLKRLGSAVQAALARRDSQAQRLEAETELRRNQALFRELIEHAPDLIALLDSEGKFQFASPSVSRVLGYSAEELRHIAVFDIVHPEDARVQLDTLKNLRQPDTITHGTARFRTKDGRYRLFNCNSRNLSDNPDVGGIVVNVRDITEERLLQERLFQVQKQEALGKLAGGISHDFNNLLTAILGNIELLQAGMDKDSDPYRLAESVKEAAEAGARISRQLTTFGKGDVVLPQDLDLSEVVRRVSGTFRALLGEHVTLKLDLSNESVFVRCDLGRLEQVLLNLAVNGQNAMEDGGILTISTKLIERKNEEGVVAHWAELKVADTGHGIPTEDQPRIFDLFYTTKVQGTGLGLYTVKSIIEGLGGTVTVKSAPASGSEFIVRIPAIQVEQTRQTAPVHAAAESPPTRGKGETILVVEDEPVVLTFAVRALGSLGYNVLSASAVDTAMEKVASAESIDILLTDIVLPGPSIGQLAKRMRSANPQSRIVFMSGYTQETFRRIPMEDPSVEFIQKPFTIAQLAKTIRKVLRPRPRKSAISAP